jgi:hypothetical protein
MEKKVLDMPVFFHEGEDSDFGKGSSEVRCRACDIGLESFVVCLEERPWLCKHSLHFGGKHFCKWPVRVSLAKQFRK